MAYINQYLKRYILKLNYCSYYNKFLLIFFLFINFFYHLLGLNIDFSFTYYLFIYIYLFVNINLFNNFND